MTHAEDTEQRQRWVRECQRFGLALSGLRQEGTVLVLTPSATAPLPTAHQLRELAEALRDDQVRYVTLDLAVYEEGSDG